MHRMLTCKKFHVNMKVTMSTCKRKSHVNMQHLFLMGSARRGQKEYHASPEGCADNPSIPHATARTHTHTHTHTHPHTHPHTHTHVFWTSELIKECV